MSADPSPFLGDDAPGHEAQAQRGCLCRSSRSRRLGGGGRRRRASCRRGRLRHDPRSRWKPFRPDCLPPSCSPKCATRIETTHDALRAEAQRRGPDVMIASTVVVCWPATIISPACGPAIRAPTCCATGSCSRSPATTAWCRSWWMRALIRPEEAEHHPRANVITRAVGAELDDFVLDKVSGRIQAGDRFLLCSDGLCKTRAGGRTGRIARRQRGRAAAAKPGGRGAGAERERTTSPR